MLSDWLCCMKLPTDALLCSNLQCPDPAHFSAVNLHAKDITDACNDAATASLQLTCNNAANSSCLSLRPSKDKKDEESVLRERVAAAMLDNNDRNFWSEVKRISANKAGIINYVEGLTESDSIAKLFAVECRELYTSVPYNKADMHDIVSSLNTALVDSPITTDSIINFIDVKADVFG